MLLACNLAETIFIYEKDFCNNYALVLLDMGSSADDDNGRVHGICS